jgi:hypothetical protein
LNGSLLFDVHNSDEVLRQVEVVPNPFAPGLFPFLDAVRGNLSGDLEGALTVADVDAGLVGEIEMRIRGTATMGCFAPGPVPIAVCEAGAGQLQPILFEVEDHGRFTIIGGIAGGVTITGGGGLVRATITGDATTASVGGVVTIKNATLTTP